jgi:RNase P subunit RPR2
MDSFTFHGPITPADVAQALRSEFDTANMDVQVLESENATIVQIASVKHPSSGGRTAFTVHISSVEDGVHITLGKQEWLGIAASLGQTALGLLKNPAFLLGRLDDLAEDVAALQLQDRVRESIERIARSMGATFQMSETFRRLVCNYCFTANPVGEPHCIACGAPLGPLQPVTCLNCGFVTEATNTNCPQCGEPLPASSD